MIHGWGYGTLGKIPGVPFFRFYIPLKNKKLGKFQINLQNSPGHFGAQSRY
jgi:hypothetical protein